MFQKEHDLPCWCGEGRSCCSIFHKPKTHLHCFKCDKQNWKEDELEEYMSTTNLATINTSLDKKPASLIKRGVVSALPGRGLSRDTCDKYGIELLYTENNQPYGTSYLGRNADGEVVAQKVKKPDKSMYWAGEGDKVTQLYGQHLFPQGGKYITITEGEEDCASVFQMMKEHTGYETPVVSVLFGAGTAEKECRENWKYLNSFDSIIVCFDGDEKGKKAAEKIAKLFHYKVKIVHFGEYNAETNAWKDANDYLKGNRQKDFIKMWYSAEKVTPKSVRSMKSLLDEMLREDTNLLIPFPYPKMNSMIGGWATGHMGFIKAEPKVGKSSLLKELIYHGYMNTVYNFGVIMLEETKKSIGLGFCALHMNKPVNLPNAVYKIEDLMAAHEAMSKEDKLMIFDPQDERTTENIMNTIIYMNKAHNVKYFVLDHVTMLSYQSSDENERKFLDKLIADLKELTTALDISIIAVSHVNDDGKTRGSRAGPQLCDWLISLKRDKLSDNPDTRNTMKLTIEDNRWGESGPADNLLYDRETGRLNAIDLDLDYATETYRNVSFDK